MLDVRKIARTLIICVGVVIASATIIQAQSLPGITIPTTAPAAGDLGPGIRQDGTFLTAPITVDGVPLFRIAASVKPSPDQLPIDVRQPSIETTISQVIALRSNEPNSGTVYDPSTLRVQLRPVGDQAVLEVTDAHHTTLIPLLTVTKDDATYARVPIETLAAQWQSKLQTALYQALLKRQPAELAHNRLIVIWVAVALVLVTVLVLLMLRALQRTIADLREKIREGAQAIEQARATSAPDEATPQRRRRFMGLAIRSTGPEMGLAIVRGVAALLGWGLVLVWFGAVVWALSRFPQTTPIGHFILLRVVSVAFVVVAAIVLIRIANIVVLRFAQTYGTRARATDAERRARLLLRIPTVASAISGFVTFAIIFIAALAGLGAIGISTGSVLTLGGIVALGVTFAAQNLLRDLLNGFFVLLEDQYVVGDYVVIDQWSGVVENMTLRVAQLRDASGNLITIPHGQTNQVVNSSRDWSRIDYRLAIDSKADTVKALDVVRQQIQKLADEEPWRDAILEPVELAGIDAMSAVGIVLRVSVKTAPLRQFELRREINARVLAGLREAGIALGTDQRIGAAPPISINPGPAS